MLNTCWWWVDAGGSLPSCGAGGAGRGAGPRAEGPHQLRGGAARGGPAPAGRRAGAAQQQARIVMRLAASALLHHCAALHQPGLHGAVRRGIQAVSYFCMGAAHNVVVGMCPTCLLIVQGRLHAGADSVRALPAAHHRRAGHQALAGLWRGRQSTRGRSRGAPTGAAAGGPEQAQRGCVPVRAPAQRLRPAPAPPARRARRRSAQCKNPEFKP